MGTRTLTPLLVYSYALRKNIRTKAKFCKRNETITVLVRGDVIGLYTLELTVN
jgi:hypothetical protein